MPFKISRFNNNLNAHVSKSVQEQLMHDRVEYETLTTNTQTALWIGKLMNDLVDEIGSDCAKAVMEACGQQCIGNNLLKRARILNRDSQDIDDLVDKLNRAHIGGGKLRHENNVIYASYERCYCGSVSKTHQLISRIYCQCSCGWYKRLFETILEKPVKVELLDSIINGADRCRFIIHM